MLKLGSYPYTYVRVNVMRGLLLKKEDYQKLMKMKVAEITKYLQDNQYQEDISDLGTLYSGAELIDRAIKANLDRNFAKLRRSSTEELRVLIDAYLKRYDVSNIKTILRVIYTNQDKEEAEKIIYDCGVLPADYYKELLKLDSVKSVLDKLKNNQVFPNLGEKSLIEVENDLDKHYYKQLLNLADQLPEEVNLFKEFIKTEIEITNLIALLRLKREKIPDSQIRSLLIFPKKNHFVNNLIGRDSVESILTDLVKRNKYKNILSDAIEDFRKTGSLMSIERCLKSFLLKRSILMLHKDILSANVILGFMFAKEVEVRNIRMLAKGKTLEVPDEFIEKELIV